MTARVLIIGLDGLEPSLVRRWIASGDLPTLGRLRDEGRWGLLRSTLPYATFPAWTSMMTGVNPGEHGVLDFARLLPGSYDLSFDSASQRRRPTLQRLVSDAGMRVASVGFPATYPPEPLNGVVIGGFDSPVAVGIDDSFVHPPELAGELQQRFGRYSFADFAETRSWVPGWHRRASRKLLQGLSRRQATASWLLAREPWDLFMVHFGESDTAAHHFWAFHDPGSPRRPERFSPPLADVLRQVYVGLDRAVSALLAKAGPDARVMIASDHGFGGSSDKVFHLNRWLAQEGLLRLKPRPGVGQRAFGVALGAGLAVAPGWAQERLWRLAPEAAGRAEARRRFAGVDWGATRAFSEELAYHPSIRLNVRGREPQGQVAPEDASALVGRLIEAVEALRDPWDDRPLVRRAWRREELYSGPAVVEAPEIILELAMDEGYSFNCLPSQGPGEIWRRLTRREKLGAKGAGMNGTHRHHGFWLIHGPGVVPRRQHAEMVDMTPTALSALGLPSPSWMEGRSHLSGEASASRSSASSSGSASRSLRGAWRSSAAEGGVGVQYTPAQQAVIEARLRKLGYL